MVCKLIKNAAQCQDCKDIIESKHRHDLVKCKCGKIFVDGGLEYLRTGFTDKIPICKCEWEETLDDN